MNKTIVSIITAVVLALGGGVGKLLLHLHSSNASLTKEVSVIKGYQDTKSSEIVDSITNMEEKLEAKVDKLADKIVEMRIRMEMAKLEHLEASLTLSEKIVKLGRLGAEIPYTGMKIGPALVGEIPTSDRDIYMLKRKVTEQRTIVESLKK